MADVIDLKAMMVRSDERFARYCEDVTTMRKSMSDMMALLQAACDKLDEHGQRLDRIEALLQSWNPLIQSLKH